MERKWLKISIQIVAVVYMAGFLLACTAPNEAAVQAVIESGSSKIDNKFYYRDTLVQCLNGIDEVGFNSGEPAECVDSSGKNLNARALSSSILKGSNFEFASLRNADLSFADLSGANFENADLTGANLNGAITHNANFKNAIGLNPVSAPIASAPAPNPVAEEIVQTAVEPISEVIAKEEVIVSQPVLVENLDSIAKVDQVLVEVEKSLKHKADEKELSIGQLKKQLELLVEEVQTQPVVAVVAPEVLPEPVVEIPKDNSSSNSANSGQSEEKENNGKSEQAQNKENVVEEIDRGPSAVGLEHGQGNGKPELQPTPVLVSSTVLVPVLVQELKDKIVKEMNEKHELNDKIEKVKELKESSASEKSELVHAIVEAVKEVKETAKVAIQENKDSSKEIKETTKVLVTEIKTIAKDESKSKK